MHFSGEQCKQYYSYYHCQMKEKDSLETQVEVTCFQSAPLSKVLTIANLWHAASSIWTSNQPEFRLSWMKLCISDNHYTTLLHNSACVVWLWKSAQKLLENYLLKILSWNLHKNTSHWYIVYVHHLCVLCVVCRNCHLIRPACREFHY